MGWVIGIAPLFVTTDRLMGAINFVDNALRALGLLSITLESPPVTQVACLLQSALVVSTEGLQELYCCIRGSRHDGSFALRMVSSMSRYSSGCSTKTTDSKLGFSGRWCCYALVPRNQRLLTNVRNTACDLRHHLTTRRPNDFIVP